MARFGLELISQRASKDVDCSTSITMRPATNQLPTLDQVALQPNRDSQRGEWIIAFERIETIEISECVKLEGVAHYVLEIYLRQTTSRIPTNRRKQSGETPQTKDRTPDFRTLRTYAEFGELRSLLYNYAHGGHYAKPCQFCEQMIQYVVTSKAQPSLLAKLVSSRDRTNQHLTAFVRDILAMTLTLLSSSEIGSCAGQTSIPRLVHDFLLQQQEESRG